MKFTCDKCSAQYMISDDKIGPSGVKVRCKKCQNLIIVRRPEASAGAGTASPAPVGNGAGEPAKGLEAELGQAFDHAFGDTPAATEKPAKGGGDLASTRMMGEDDAAKITAAPVAAAAAAATEWYVAIGQAQVGPLPASEVKKKWEAGDVGPDSLVWRPGMGEWSPLSTVTDLASFLAPIPRPAAKTARDGALKDGRGEPAQTPVPEPTWKPVGASALAALASEEIATRKVPEPKSQVPRAAPAGAKSLMDALPDGGGVDPTGAIPLTIKALEHTAEKKIERRTSVARGAQETRHRRGVVRAIVVTVVVVLLVLGAAAAGLLWYSGKQGGNLLAGVTGAMPPAAPAAVAPAPAPPPSAAKAPVAVAPPAAVQPAVPPPAVAEPQKAPPPAEGSARGERSSSKHGRRESTSKSESKVAAAPPPPPPPEPPPAPEKKKKGDLLDFESNDSALDAALGQSPSGRSVYVPPARRGGGSDVPDKLSSGDINAAVAGRIDSLRRCVTEQKARDPDASGILKMRWIIGGDGGVRDVKCLTSEFAQGPFAQCIAGVLRSIKFPRSQTKGQEVTFPFNF